METVVIKLLSGRSEVHEEHCWMVHTWKRPSTTCKRALS